MNRFVSAFALACLGATAASLIASWRRDQMAAQDFKEEAIHRWEDDGGAIPKRPTPGVNVGV